MHLDMDDKAALYDLMNANRLLQELHDSYREELCLYIKYRLSKPMRHLMEDVLMETLLRVCSDRARLMDREDPARWIFAVAKNVCREMETRERRRSVQEVPLEPFDPVDGEPDHDWQSTTYYFKASEQSDARLLEQELRDGVLGPHSILTERERELFAGIWLEGLSIPELAERHGILPGTVRNGLWAARMKMREYVSQLWGWDGNHESDQDKQDG